MTSYDVMLCHSVTVGPEWPSLYCYKCCFHSGQPWGRFIALFRLLARAPYDIRPQNARFLLLLKASNPPLLVEVQFASHI